MLVLNDPIAGCVESTSCKECVVGGCGWCSETLTCQPAWIPGKGLRRIRSPPAVSPPSSPPRLHAAKLALLAKRFAFNTFANPNPRFLSFVPSRDVFQHWAMGRTPRVPVRLQVSAEGRGHVHAAAGQPGAPGRQGLTLVHFSAQPEPFLTQNAP
jgi:hypothetical protein